MHHGALCLLLSVVAAEDAAPARPAVFDLPFVQMQYGGMQQQAQALFAEKKYSEAEKLCRAAQQLIPHDPLAPYNLACALARQDKTDDALAALAQAIRLGFNQAAAIANDDDLKSLRAAPRFRELVEQAKTAQPDPTAGWKYEVAPASPADGVALVDEGNTAWDPRAGVLRAFFRFDAPPAADSKVVDGMNPAGDLVRKWFAEGTAAGNFGDLYDNHDSDHANMRYASFPQLTRVEFADAAKKRQLHHGLQLAFFYNRPTLGNSSTALTQGPFWRSQPRNALTQPLGPHRLAAQYFSNHLFVYPEHRDHDPGRNGADGQGHGDVLPANTPYLVVSQGSSGSDIAFLHALTLTLAAFTPETKTKLTQAGLLAPTLQMIFRQSNKMVERPADYFTGAAHPTVFDGKQIDQVKMVTLAHEMTPDILPPLAQAQVVKEDLGTPGVDYFDVGAKEQLFDTPSAIARVVKSVAYRRTMTLSAETSRDPQQLPLTYKWALLRGDPERVRIRPLNDSGSQVEVTLEHQPRRPVTAGSALESSRVDVGLFVSNERYASAPAFVSWQFLENQRREYDAAGQIRVVDYADDVARKNYVDPLIDLPKDWRDEYQHDDAGRLLGWTRVRGDQRQRFTFDGCLVTETDDQDRPRTAQVVRYVAQPRMNQAPLLKMETTDALARYSYAGPADLRGNRAANP